MNQNVIDQYIESCQEEKRKRLYEIRELIKAAAPDATEKISWQMPTFYLGGNLVHFAQQKAHIGFYPGESGVAHFIDRLENYKHSKGAIQFPDNKPLPRELITEIVLFRVKENREKIKEKNNK